MRGKLTATVTMRCDEELLRRLDEEQRRRERELGVPLSRGVLIRLLIEERLGPRPDARARE